MADSVRFEMKGLRELGERLRGLDAKVQQKLAGQATGAMARVVKGAAKAIVRANSYETGTLDAAIITKKLGKTRASGMNLTSAHLVTPRHRKSGRKTKTLQATAPHALYVQFGTLYMRAEPFLDVALERNRDRVENAGRDKLKAGLDKAGA